MSESRSQSQQSQSTGAIQRQNTGGEKQSSGMDRNALESGGPALEYLGHIQRVLGNAGVGSLWRSGTLQRQLGIQRQLTVGAADDPLEREADEAARRVMTMPNPVVAAEDETVQMQRSPLQISRPGDGSEEELQYKLRRACAACESEEQMQKSPAVSRMSDDEELQQKRLQREADASSSAGGPVGPDLANRIGALRGGAGQALPESERSFFEPRFNQDFSNIRIHTGAEAASVARDINARAFTIGRDVVFGAGEYRPGTDEGRRLMAHELTHTVQQGATASKVAAKAVVRREALPVIRRQDRPGVRTRQVRILSGSDRATAGQVRVLDSEGVYSQTVAIKNGMARVEAAPGDSLVILANFGVGLYGKTVEVGAADAFSVQIERADLGPQAVKPVSISIDESKAAVNGEAYAGQDLVKLLFENRGQIVSLGEGGTLTMNFDPPIAYQSGVQTLSFLNYKPGEDYEITLANSTSGADLKMGEGSSFSSPKGSDPQNREVSGRYGQKPRYFRQIIIKDLVKAKHADHPDYPGLDLKNMTAGTSGRIDAITILMDMSGSMLRGEVAGDETVSGVEAQTEGMRGDPGPRRSGLYQLASDAVRKDLLPRGDLGIPVNFYGFFFDAGKKQAMLDSRFPNVAKGDEDPRSHPDFPIGSTAQARFAALYETCKSRSVKDFTPLNSAFEAAFKKVRADSSDAMNHLFVVVTDGVGSSGGEINGQSVALNETLADLEQQSKDLSFGGNRRGFLELIGFKIPREERASVLSFALPGWTTSTYDARNLSDLRAMLTGIRKKYGIKESSGGVAPEFDYLDRKRGRNSGTASLCDMLDERFPSNPEQEPAGKKQQTIRPSRIPGAASRNLAIGPRTAPEGQRMLVS